MAKNVTDTDNTMDVFSGWDNPSDVDFFDGTPEPTGGDGADPVESAQPADPVDNADDPTPTPAPASEEDDFDFFGETDIDKDNADDAGEGDGDEPAPVVGNNISILNRLKEKGLIDYELEEGEELTEERAEELLEDSFEDSIESRLEELMSNLPPLTKQLLKFAANGGNEQEFLAKAIAQPTATKITKDMDLENDANAELIVKTQLEADGHDEEYIQANLEFLKDSGKLKNLAKSLHPKMLQKDEAARQAEIERVSADKIARKENQRKFKSNLTTTISSLEEVGQFKLSKKDKQELPSYMADPVVKHGSNNVSQFQKDIYDALQDENNAILLAKIVRNKFDFSEIAKAATTKTVKGIQEDVRRAKRTSATSGGSQPSRAKKNLADYF